MKDKEIRSILIEYLKNEYEKARIYQEKSIGDSICDLMLVSDKLIGFEIKSDEDNYERLQGQIASYNKFFEKNYIVVGKSHVNSIQEKVPEAWGVFCIEQTNIKLVRDAKKNKQVDRKSQLSILWAVELKNLLLKNGLPLYAQKPKAYIIDRILDSVEEKRLGEQIASELLSRDYSVFDAKDVTIRIENESLDSIDGLPIKEIIDALSEQDFDEFTLAHWISLYRKGKAIFEKKKEMRQAKIERLPHEIPYTDIEVSLGAPWVSKEIVKDFIKELLQVPASKSFEVHYESITGNWALTNKKWIAENNVLAENTYGLHRYNAMQIIEAILNVREIRLYDYGTEFNEVDTLAALEKQKLIKEKFAEWIWLDEDRRWEVEEAYNKMFAGFKPQRYDGSSLVFPGMNPEMQLFDYQKDAVQKIISTKNTLLAFDVGAGKTYIMIAAAMEMRRQGISRKNLFVVPNNIVGQWEKMFLELYPRAKVLAIEPKGFQPEMRPKVLSQMRDGDYDGIIIAYSCFEMIGFSSEYATAKIQASLSELQTAIQTFAPKAESRSAAQIWRGEQVPVWSMEAWFKKGQIEKEKKKILKMLNEVFEGAQTISDGITFDQLEINTLFLDEAHNYKNLPLQTRLKNLRGINTAGSKKCAEMLQKVRYVQERNGGRGVVFSTGTPLCNSLADAYVMQTYLQPEDMERLHISKFDDWVKTFAQPEQVCEIDVTAAMYRIVQRFARFHNLPELAKMFSSISIFHAMTGVGELPDFDEYTDVITEKSPALGDYMLKIAERAEKIRAKEVHPSKDNMLKVSTDGRKAALDLTLVGEEQPYDETSKIVRCAENIWDLYNRFDGCSQLVFCDYSTPKGESFSVYKELKERLQEKGIPSKEIAFVHSYNNELAKLKLYENVNSGKVRVLIGSTFKLGIGANVQTKLKAVHHLDVPWRPADMVQREGRILRRGNENKDIYIYRYIAEGSFDSYSWQILETKQNFISQFLTGSSYQRTASDLEDNILTYAEAKALALSSPLLKMLAEKENELRNYTVLYMREIEVHEWLKRELVHIDEEISQTQEKVAATVRNGQYVESCGDAERKEEIADFCTHFTSCDVYEPNRSLGSVLGFNAYLPAVQSEKKPYYFLERENVSYVVEISETLVGNGTRVMNFFKKFSRFEENFKKRIYELIERKKQIEIELEQPIRYKAEMEQAQKERDEIKSQIEAECF